MADFGPGSIGGGGGLVGSGFAGGGGNADRGFRTALRRRAAAVKVPLSGPSPTEFGQQLTLPTLAEAAFFPVGSSAGAAGEPNPLAAGLTRNFKFRFNSRERRSLIT